MSSGSTTLWSQRTVLACAVAATLCGAGAYRTAASHINAPLDTFRNQMPNEGYLEHQSNPSVARFGDEWTGWVDIRHPAMDGTTAVFAPFDRSDHFVQVRTTTLTDNSNPAQTAAPNIPRDFDFASKIYAQAGISVNAHSHRAYTSGTNPPGANFNFPLTHGRGAQTGLPDEELAIRNGLHNANPAAPNTVVENYYATNLHSNANGETYAPRFDGQPGMFLADQAVSSTFGHELGHMLLNGDPSEDNGDNTNFQFASGQNYALTDVTHTRGKMTDAQIDRIYLNGGTNARNFVQKPDGDHRNGNRVDFDFVTDHNRLESRANGADNHPTVDRMYWGINPGAPNDTDHNGHDHTGLANFPHPGNFGGPNFHFADIFSMTLRYSDFELGADGINGLYTRDGALDYEVLFVDAGGNTSPGIPIVTFEFGWTASTIVDNWLTRWYTPIDAVGMYVWASNQAPHDGITQIDAVIVSTVPEPAAATAIIALIGGSLFRRRRVA